MCNLRAEAFNPLLRVFNLPLEVFNLTVGVFNLRAEAFNLLPGVFNFLLEVFNLAADQSNCRCFQNHPVQSNGPFQRSYRLRRCAHPHVVRMPWRSCR